MVQTCFPLLVSRWWQEDYRTSRETCFFFWKRFTSEGCASVLSFNSVVTDDSQSVVPVRVCCDDFIAAASGLPVPASAGFSICVLQVCLSECGPLKGMLIKAKHWAGDVVPDSCTYLVTQVHISVREQYNTIHWYHCKKVSTSWDYNEYYEHDRWNWCLNSERVYDLLSAILTPVMSEITLPWRNHFVQFFFIFLFCLFLNQETSKLILKQQSWWPNIFAQSLGEKSAQ